MIILGWRQQDTKDREIQALDRRREMNKGLTEDFQHAENALRESEQRYRSLYTRTPAMLHSIDPESRLLDVSDYWLEVLGYERHEVIGKKATEFLTEESRRHAETVSIPDFLKTGYARDISYQFRKKNGEVIDVLLSAIAERDEKGNFLRSLAVLTDVTDRKKAEQALRESEQRYRTLVEHAPEAIVVFDADLGRFIDANANAISLFGIGREAFLQVDPLEISPLTQLDGRASSEVAEEKIEQALRGEAPDFEWIHQDVTGKSIICQKRLVRLPATGRKLIRASITDISERKREESKRLVMHRLREKVWQMQRAEDISTIMETVRESLQRMEVVFQDCGVNVVDASKDPPAVRFHNLTEQAGSIESAVETGRDLVIQIWRAGLPVYRRDLETTDTYQERVLLEKGLGHPVRSVLDVPFSHGTLAVNSSAAHAFLDEDIASLKAVAGVLSEGFGRMEDFQQLEQRNQELAMLMQTSQVVNRSLDLSEVLNATADELQIYLDCDVVEIYTVDTDRGILKLLVYRELWVEIAPEEDTFKIGEGLSGWIAKHGESIRIDRPEDDLRSISKPGLVQTFLGVPVVFENIIIGVITVARFQDDQFEKGVYRPLFTKSDENRLQAVADTVAITIRNAQLNAERSQMEEELHQTQKIQAVGQLTAGVAHNFNNMLTGVLGNLELWGDSQSPNPKWR